ncbi:hypothetical protein IWW36_004601 [Coemansia brasiliensis]|uniref:Uncharacterized protein n=1 Tax=Coemansia brasiliensis TaxID=2650707 RepID=A0A9W8LYW2_9FUNG|nr:hypothetical protein IWW36_004601 [Coemansia brasiliensis]
MAPQQISGALPVATQANLQQLLPKVREIVQRPENSSIPELSMAIHLLQPQINANPAARQGILDAINKLGLELQKRRTQVQAAMRQQQTQQQQQQTPQQQQQQTPQQTPGTLPTAANGMFSQAPQFPNQQQLLQMRLQGQQSQAQLQALQTQPQLAAALATAAQQRQSAASAPTSNLGNEEMQGWIALLRKTTRPFTYNGTQVQLTLPQAHRAMTHFRQHGDKQGEASIMTTINEILNACREEAKKPIPQEVMQLLMQDLTAHSNAPQAVSGGLPAQPSMGVQSPASSMAGAPIAATAAATTSVAKKQPSGKNSPAAKAKKKSQSPRAPAKPRKSSPPKPNITPAVHNAQVPTLASAVTGQPAIAASAQPQAQPMQQQQQQMPPISAEAATRVVAEISSSLDPAMIKRHEHIALEEEEKRIVRGHMVVLEQLAKMSSRLLPVVYMRTRSRDVVVKALSIQMLIAEQLRIVNDGKFIIRPHNVAETPLTNMHPDAVTSDPALENFQKAVKHPLDPGNLKLPAAKKRVMAKSSSVGSNSSAAPAAQTQAQSAGFAPAPLMLPPNMTREEFERLPLETRMAILKDQQSEKIRKNTSGISPVAMMPTQATNPLLAAVMQGSNQGAAVSAESAEMEQQLQALEKDKWNKPLEYMMCVLGRFSKSAEKAGMEPAPILQQAFWPIAQKTMSNNWGAISTDAVL